ncbi:unnamed protein product [Boreogadus saida]
MASANTSWSEEDFSCSICLDVFSIFNMVTSPCGHNFCRTCFTKFWDEQVKYKCPVCNKKLRDDAVLLKMVQQYEVDVTLDPDTAHPKLILSEDGKQVHDGGVENVLPENPKIYKVFVCSHEAELLLREILL